MSKIINVFRCRSRHCSQPCFVVAPIDTNIKPLECLRSHPGGRKAYFTPMLPAVYVELTEKLAKAMSYEEAMPDEFKFGRAKSEVKFSKC